MKTTTFLERVEKRETGTDARRCAHAHHDLPHLIRRKIPQGVATDIGNRNILTGKGFLDGMKCTAMTASRTHLGRTFQYDLRQHGFRVSGVKHVGPGVVQHILDFV